VSWYVRYPEIRDERRRQDENNSEFSPNEHTRHSHGHEEEVVREKLQAIGIDMLLEAMELNAFRDVEKNSNQR
jgi:hypothetical protein